MPMAANSATGILCKLKNAKELLISSKKPLRSCSLKRVVLNSARPRFGSKNAALSPECAAYLNHITIKSGTEVIRYLLVVSSTAKHMSEHTRDNTPMKKEGLDMVCLVVTSVKRWIGVKGARVTKGDQR